MSEKTEYKVREVTLKDLDDVIRVNRENLPENYPPYFFKMHCERFPRAFLVAESEGKIVGYIMCRVEEGSLFTFKKPFGRQGHIISIAVVPYMRRKGVGTRLMKEAMKALKDVYKVDEYYLEVRVSNIPAISLYEKLGFKKIRVLRGYYRDGEDAYLMARPAD